MTGDETRAAAQARAREIAERFDDLRVEQRFYCRNKRCGRMVAAIVVHDGERVLFKVGGVDQRTAATKAGHEAAAQAYQERHPSLARWHERYVEQLERDGGREEPPAAGPLPSRWPAGAVDEVTANCRRCHQTTWLRIDQDGVSLLPE